MAMKPRSTEAKKSGPRVAPVITPPIIVFTPALADPRDGGGEEQVAAEHQAQVHFVFAFQQSLVVDHVAFGIAHQQNAEGQPVQQEGGNPAGISGYSDLANAKAA